MGLRWGRGAPDQLEGQISLSHKASCRALIQVVSPSFDAIIFFAILSIPEE